MFIFTVLSTKWTFFGGGKFKTTLLFHFLFKFDFIALIKYMVKTRWGQGAGTNEGANGFAYYYYQFATTFMQ